MESKSVTVSPARPRRRPVIGRRLAVPLPRRRRPSAVRHVSAASRTSASAAGQRVCRKYRRSRFDVRRLQQREYDKLRRIVPALRVPDSAEKMRPRRVSKVQVVEETIRYIDQLHRMLAKRVQADDTSSKKTVVDAAKTVFICRHQPAADDDDVSMGNSRHDNRTTADAIFTPTCVTSSTSESLSDNSACSTVR